MHTLQQDKENECLNLYVVSCTAALVVDMLLSQKKFTVLFFNLWNATCLNFNVTLQNSELLNHSKCKKIYYKLQVLVKYSSMVDTFLV